jgi:hypothetical protein
MADALGRIVLGDHELVVLDHRRREPLEEHHLLVAAQRWPSLDADAALLVPAHQQQVERRLVEALAVTGQLHAVLEVERAQQPAQQGAAGQAA